MEYGPSNYTDSADNRRGYKKILKIHGGNAGQRVDNFFRIYPPMLDQARTGRWFAWEAVHWGYVGQSNNDPSKTVARTFICPLVKRQGRVDVPCAECQLIEEYEEARRALDPSEGKDKKNRKLDLTEGQRAQLAFLEEFLDGREGEQGRGAHRRTLKVRVNAYSEADKAAGLLLLAPHIFYAVKAKNEKEAVSNPGLFDELLKSGYDPLSPTQGAWINIIRTGNGSGRGEANAKDRVVIRTALVPGTVPPQMGLVPAPLVDKGDLDLAASQCYDILDDSHTATPSPETIQTLVDAFKAGLADPEMVDKILDGDSAPAAPKGPRTETPTSFRAPESADVNATMSRLTEPTTPVAPAAPPVPPVIPAAPPPPPPSSPSPESAKPVVSAAAQAILDKIAAARKAAAK